MLADSCTACGAPATGASPICNYCGAALRTVELGEELDAVEAVCALARSIANESETMFGFIGEIYGFSPKRNRIANLWGTAFIPTTPTAQLKMLQQVLLLVDTSFNFLFPMKTLAKQRLNAVLMGRAEMLLTLILSHSSATDGADHASRTGQALYELTQKRYRTLKWILIAFFAVPLVLAFGFSLIGGLLILFMG